MCPQILIVDDSKTVRLLVHRALRPLRCEVIDAETGQDGLVLAAQFLPAAILLDTLMPGLDGFETLRLLRENSSTALIPVIILSANSAPVTEERMIAAGGAGLLCKPLREERVRFEIARVCGLSSGTHLRAVARS